MSPIEGISDIRHYPRLGKIRTGEKAEGQRGPYPRALDHFKVPDEVAVVHGDKPTELPIMFPSDDLELVAPQWLKCYSYSQGLICRGNGRTCRRKVDVDTGDFADKNTREWDMADGICDPEHCPKIGDKQCRRMMSLLFILPEVPGLGVYQLDTGSFYSIVNLNSQLAPDGFLRHFTNGRIAFIPLILSLEPREVTPPGVGRKTVHVLNVRADVKLADIIRISRQKPAQVLLGPVDDEEIPTDFYPEEVINGSESAQETATRENEGQASNVCHCPKPVLAEDVMQDQSGPCYHRSCGGYLCTPPIDCFPGCPHVPLGEPTEEPEDVGVHIDLVWLDETMRRIHWSEDTAKTRIASLFRVDTQGKLTEVLQRLNREQAEQFTRELNDRAAKMQPGLFD